MEQLNRAIALHQLLLDFRYPVPRSVILERLECSASTFKRLLELLRDRYQAPILWDPVARGYRYDTDDGRFTLPGVWFTASEAFALLMANRLLQDVQPGLHQQGLAQLQERIGTLLGPQWKGQADRLRVESIGRQYVAPELFLPLVQALFARHRLQLHYRATSHQADIRCVSPQRLCWYRDNWYLLAWCHEREALRIFALSRITEPLELDETAYDSETQELDALFSSGYGIFVGSTLQQAELRFDPSVAPWVRDVQWHRDQIQTLEQSGHIRLSFPYADQRELVRDLMRFSGEIDVLAPPELRQCVIAAMVAGLKKHGAGTSVVQPLSQWGEDNG
ncbi:MULTISPECIES: helix-turn-helix transcriptional regulator [Edwardsiella]|uniref:Helix-turn-helix type 11 domain protein n=2 Tax=Edwardsiella anguillarum TaxID=1821960 RepID=A0A076LMK0_9GAMM|nr:MULTISPECIES: WYL domain-containing protein [Edwardsiella]AIJ09061.1 helix-turn-helix type 11 domain protein [Edwardsiella anguillarum ET080813]AKR77025.1 WYL domain-containing protein [Edwardsiella sp. LADL05-105]KAB0587195.1 WYL domain-containing protein [Edwardsiella anguillarum]WHP84665.1 WYL domain-containing protein [Edwardsiella anguillarum]WHP88448.1 WYL domain-containing protein [Edwardsiella anguillarum]